MQVRPASCFGALILSCISATTTAADLFSGVYLSESRENFGTSVPGEVRIEVTRTEDGYLLKLFRNGKPIATSTMTECDPRTYSFSEEYWKDAKMAGLCTADGINLFVYTEKPLPSPVQRGRFFHSRYYAHVQFAFYAFRKAQ
jgi:hypothetical protein